MWSSKLFSKSPTFFFLHNSMNFALTPYYTILGLNKRLTWIFLFSHICFLFINKVLISFAFFPLYFFYPFFLSTSSENFYFSYIYHTISHWKAISLTSWSKLFIEKIYVFLLLDIYSLLYLLHVNIWSSKSLFFLIYSIFHLNKK